MIYLRQMRAPASRPTTLTDKNSPLTPYPSANIRQVGGPIPTPELAGASPVAYMVVSGGFMAHAHRSEREFVTQFFTVIHRKLALSISNSPTNVTTATTPPSPAPHRISTPLVRIPDSAEPKERANTCYLPMRLQ